MSFPRHLLASSLFAAAVFSAATFPLAAMGSQPLTVQLDEQPMFAGQIKELAGPYVGLATVISLGAGVASMAMMSWSQSSRKLGDAEDEMSGLRQELQNKENQIERLRFSDSKLAAAGLESFLEPKEVAVTATLSTSEAVAEPPAAILSTPEPRVETAKASEVTLTHQAEAQAAMAMAQAQARMGLSQSTQPAIASSTDHKVETPKQIDELLSHLKQVMSQIEKLNSDADARNDIAKIPSTVWQQQRLAS